MTITSMPFVLFLIALAVLYFVVPGRFRWLALLAASLGFYAAAGLRFLPWLLVTALSAYAAALALGRIDGAQKAYFAAHPDLDRAGKAALRRRYTCRKRWVMAGALVLNFGLLAVFKYSGFVLEQWSRLTGGPAASLSLVAPLGISFYTFQTMGYVVDVYWGKAAPERNPLRMLLFTSFFPQITQGPISTYGQLARQLYEPHRYSFENFQLGAQRMLWGYFKKLALADVLAPWVDAVLHNGGQYTGPAVLVGIFFYSIQIYADFSGYMDIMCGFCQILGIRLEENFLRPYFSKSIAEYWRRWHMSLGAWFKNYLYYPIAVSKWNTRLGKWSRKKLGKTFGQALPASVALVAVWLTTGLWHGASWGYIAWGGVNGLIIIASLWLEPVYARTRTALHIREDGWGLRAFRVLRTYLLMCFIKVLPETGTLAGGLALWRQVFTGWGRSAFTRAGLFPYKPMLEQLGMVVFGTGLLLLTSLLQRREPVRARLGRLPQPVRALLFAALLVLTAYFGIPASGNVGGFLYAQF